MATAFNEGIKILILCHIEQHLSRYLGYILVCNWFKIPFSTNG